MKLITTAILLAMAFITSAETNTEKDNFQQAIQKLSNQKITIDAINDTPINGIKEIVLSGGKSKEIIYLTENAEYMFQGNLMNLKSRQNLTEKTQNSLRQELMSDFKKNNKSIDFLPEEMTDQITVFTDIDCGVCRKFHENVSSFNEAGIGVSYLFFPRAGIGSASHQKAVNVWCSADQQQAINLAKSGVELKPLMCPNPIESQYNLALSAGVNGTPYIVLDDGTLIPGYLTAAQLKQRLDSINNQN